MNDQAPSAGGVALDAPNASRGGFRWPAERPRRTPPSAPLQRRASFQRWLKRTIVALGVLLAIATMAVPLPDGLRCEAKPALAVFILATALWVSNALPYGVTGLLAVALLGLTGAMRPGDAYAAFGSPAIFFLIGIFIIGGALVETGLSKRCALLFLRRFESSPYAFANGMMLAAAFGTIWMPNQATTAMLFPIAMEVVMALRLRPGESPYARTLLFSLAWGAMIGSNASFLGSSRAALALGMLQRSYSEGISFVQWMAAGAPLVFLGLLTTPLVLRLSIPRENVAFAQARVALERAVAEMGRMERRQYVALGVLVATVAAWVLFGGTRVDLGIIALLGTAALFAFRVIQWHEVERHIFWNIVLMYGGAIAIGAALERTGAATWIMQRFVGDLHLTPFSVIAGAAVLGLLVSEVMRNAGVAVLLPLAFTAGSHAGASPIALTLAISFGAGLDFLFPMSTAPNTIIFSSGYLRTTAFLKPGLAMTAVSIALLLLVLRFWWPLLGLV